MATLITGAGQVGSHVAKMLVEKEETPVLFDIAPRADAIGEIVDLEKVKLVRGDILELSDVIQVIKSEKIDTVIHTAAQLPTMEAKHLGTVKVNVMGLTYLLEAARATDLRRIVYTSSSVLYYGSLGAYPPNGPIKEDYRVSRLEGAGFMYGTTKIAAEYIGLDYADTYGIDFLALRLGHVWGRWSGAFGAPISFILQTLVEEPLRGKPAVIGHPIFSWKGKEGFVNVNNVAHALVLARDAKGLKHRVFNIFDDRPYSFDDWTSTVKKLIPGAEIRVVAEPAGGYAGTPSPPAYPFDTSRAREELGYKPIYDLEKGLREYVDWVKSRLKINA